MKNSGAVPLGFLLRKKTRSRPVDFGDNLSRMVFSEFIRVELETVVALKSHSMEEYLIRFNPRTLSLNYGRLQSSV